MTTTRYAFRSQQMNNHLSAVSTTLNMGKQWWLSACAAVGLTV
ncbi:hypothetical protein [Thalassolituus hydrocarboniclasticus]|nr:hypothetical protein [Thalassolituus hydrocarboniclasticus]